jgi:hypothetical protein
MEFEENKPTSDEDHRLAEAKKLTLQPVHADIMPDALPDTELGARHLNEPAIANMANDTEAAATFIQPTSSILGQRRTSSKSQGKLIASLIIGVTIFAGLVAIALLK